MILIDFLIILILILLNGVFVAAEFAIIGVRPTRITQLVKEGNKTAKRVESILSNPAQVDRYIASAQLGITLASLGLGMYGEPVIAHLIEPPLHDWFGLSGDIVHTISFFIALGLITYLHVVVGEMVPKSLALQSAERVVLILSTPMFLMQRLFSVAITVLNKIGLFVLWLMRVPPPSEGNRLHTPDELELIISDSVVGGLIDSGEEQLLQKILDFPHLKVSDVMTPRRQIEGVPIEISKNDLLDKMFTSVHTRFPVYDGSLDEILGMVHLKDLVQIHLDDKPYHLPDLLHELPYIPEGVNVDELLSLLKQQHIHMAIAIDEYGGTAGIVTLEDLLEEIVGEVRDEFDIAETDHITVVDPGHLVVLGGTRLDELEPFLTLPDSVHQDDVVSVGGLMVANLDLPLNEGDEVSLEGVTFRAESVDGLKVEEVSIHFDVETDDSVEDTSEH